MIGGRRAMALKRTHPKEGKRSGGGDGSVIAQATQLEESHVMDLSQVEYLNYHDQVHHDVTDGGYG